MVRNQTAIAAAIVTLASLLAGTPSAMAQSCEELCRTDPTFKIMNQQRCLTAELTGRCDGGTEPRPQPGPGPDIESAPRLFTDAEFNFLVEVGVPSAARGWPARDQEAEITETARELLDRFQSLNAEIDSLMRIRPLDRRHEAELRAELERRYEELREVDWKLDQLTEIHRRHFRSPQDATR